MDWPVRHGSQVLVWHASTPVTPHACAAATCATALAPGIVHNQPPRVVAPPCAGCSTRPGAYAMMRLPRRTQGESQGGRRRGGFCRRRRSGAGPLASRVTPAADAARGGAQEGTWDCDRDEVERGIDAGAVR